MRHIPGRRFAVLVVATSVAAVVAGCGGGGGGSSSGAGLSSPSVTPSAAQPPPATAAPTPTPTPTRGTASAAPPAGPAGGPVPAGFRPQSVTFTSADDGWVLGTAPCPNPVCTSMVRTRDAGRTWVGIPAPVEQLAAVKQAGLWGVRFADPADGVAFGDDLWFTHDGGASWQQAPSPGGTGTVVPVLETAGGYVLAAVTPATSSGPPPVTVYRSPVGDLQWTPVFTAPAPGTGAAAASGVDLAVHGSTAWLVADGVAYSSPDGVHWSRSGFTCGTQAAGGAVVGVALGPDPAYVALTCAGQGAAGSMAKELAVSTDAGAHFAATAVGPPRGGDGAEVAVAAPGDVTVGSASGASFLYATFDGGGTWGTAVTADTGGQYWFDLGFTTPTQGVAIAGNAVDAPGNGLPPSALWMTRDGGHTWATVSFGG